MPDDGNQYELLEGVLRFVTPPGRLHQEIMVKMVFVLEGLATQYGGYVAIAPFAVMLSRHNGFEPDIMYIAPGRDFTLSDRGLEGAPDLVVEVASPSTRYFDRTVKLRVYLESGVREVWLVDPQSSTVTVHHPGRAPTVVPFGEPIPSTVVDAGDAGLGRFTPA